MGFCKDLYEERMEELMTDFLVEFSFAFKRVVSDEDYEETYLQSYEAFQEEIADMAHRPPDRSATVKAKIARALELKKARDARRERIAELRAKFPNRPKL